MDVNFSSGWGAHRIKSDRINFGEGVIIMAGLEKFLSSQDEGISFLLW